ncbi:ectonucleotide pyrophosphatase/phosphodiesterase [Pedobacter mucosus]|uniref:alkaline phosphatase family protein n=1 Tax=Pedobacter mucosus TaxID=2895286 RepID=UPI001EE3A4BA|nr:ectonucleotide pyrophosphatase/phosphodiesterase [Pedobacter mucosus]UKT64648.1 ectonucleotide pyrophosphatase/phosphodiesterase [Pedobacter mucosus]
MLKIKYGVCLVVSTFFLLTESRVQAQSDTTQHIMVDRKKDPSQIKKPYVILISADGFRYDYAERYRAQHLIKLSQEGVQAKSMIPSFPSVTFPNHYSIVTGMYPSHHGLVNNSFLDENTGERYSMSAKAKVLEGKWYGGTPLWVLAEQHKMISANMFWVGSEAEIKGIRPTYYYDYTEKFSVGKRIEIIKDWLSLPEDKRPHLITFYLSEPDHTSHSYGPDAPQTEQAVKMIDSVVFQLTEAIKPLKLPVNYIFLSDHGMTAVDRDHPIATPKAIDTAKYIIASSGTLMDIHAKNKADILPLFQTLKNEEKDYKVYLKTEMPAHFHYNATDDRMNRIGDILLVPEWPKVFSSRKPGAGYHGFDPEKVKDMHATFFAWGPAFKKQLKIPSFENVNVYPLIANMLGLSYQEKIDGKLEVLKSILK